MATEYRVEAVYRESHESVIRLANDLCRTYPGRMKIGEASALARVIAMTHDGSIEGFWGQLTWRHGNGQYDNGDVYYSW